MADAPQRRLHDLLAAAQQRGLLPADATLPAQDARPWPVLLLVAAGAWLAAIPFIVIIGLLLGDFVTRGAGTYLIGVLLLAGAVVVLRSRELPVFVEQLAVPALLVGGGALAFGLGRDLGMQAACAVLCGVSLVVAVLVPSGWLRNLLGALAAALAAGTLLPERLHEFGRAHLHWWTVLHFVLAAGLAALLLHESVLARGREARTGAAVESIAGGWVAATLVGLAWWSGMTFLVGGMLGGGLAGELGREATRHASNIADHFMQFVSAALAAGACALLAVRWPVLRQPLAAVVALVLVGLSWFLTALGAVLLALAGLATSRRWRLAALAALAAAWIVGSFYYQLAWPLATKALVLVAAGGALGVIAWLAQRSGAGRTFAASSFERRPALWLAGAAALTLLVANVAIWQKEALIARGDKVFVRLAPADPRSLMQGDYMRLNFSVPLTDQVPPAAGARRPFVVGKRDARGVAEFLRVADGDAPLAPGEFRVELTPRDGRWTFVTDAWYFREGDAARWEQARFGEFRVDARGRALLVGLADEKLQAIQP